MVSVKFIKPWSAYSPGDIAGFDEKRAAALVDAGAAELYDENAEVAAGEPAPAAEQAGATPDASEASEVKSGRAKK